MKLFAILSSLPLFHIVNASQTSFQPTMNYPQDPNPLGRFEAKEGAHLYTAAQALLFQITQDDLPYAYLTNTSSNTHELFQYRSDWRWGFRIIAGYHLKHDGWDLEADYLRFTAQTTKRLSNPNTSTFDLMTPADNTPFDNEQILFQWNFALNQWDLFQSRSFFFSKYFRLEPLLGLRNLLLGQQFTLQTDNLSTIRQQNKGSYHFWGMGVLAGINNYWSLNRQFNLYGSFKISSLFGHFQPRLIDAINTASGPLNELKNGYQKANKTCLDLAIGVRWDKNFYDEKLHLAVNIGFEESTYFNMNKMYLSYLTSETNNGLSGRDLSLQGLSFGLRLDY